MSETRRQEGVASLTLLLVLEGWAIVEFAHMLLCGDSTILLKLS